MKIKNLLLVLVVLFYSCNSTEKNDETKIAGLWELSEVITFDKNNSTLDQQTRSKLGKELISKGLELYFFPDSTYSQIKNDKITHGEWSYSNDKAIKYGNHRLEIVVSEQGKMDKELMVKMFDGDNNIESDLKFIEAAESLKDFKQDPFHFSNNIWRQKPQKKETNKEIAHRLANHILHNAYVLKAAHDRNVGSVSFNHSRGLIRIYQGAIGAVKEEKIKKSWVATYYDKEDAMKAYYLFKSYLGKEGVYKAKSSGDWVKDDYEILLKLASKIKETKAEDTERFTK